MYMIASSQLSTWIFRCMIRFPFALPSSAFSSIENDMLHDLDPSFAATLWQLVENGYCLHAPIGLSGQKLYIHKVELAQDMNELYLCGSVLSCSYQMASNMWNTVLIHFKMAMTVKGHYVDTGADSTELSDAELFNLSPVVLNDMFHYQPIPYSHVWRYYWLHYSLFWWMMSLTSKVLVLWYCE